MFGAVTTSWLTGKKVLLVSRGLSLSKVMQSPFSLAGSLFGIQHWTFLNTLTKLNIQTCTALSLLLNIDLYDLI